MFPYGAQYYRTPNPPESEWEKDFKTMADHGFTIAKIWAMWSWMNYEPDKYDFSHFDRLFEIAEQNGIKLVINTILENAPYWFTRQHSDCYYTTSDGLAFEPVARSNTPGGGWPGLCVDNDLVKVEAGKFLKAIGSRYAGSPTLWGYDVWNEVFFEPIGHPPFDQKLFCHCEGTKAKFLAWLKERYVAIGDLNRAWHRRYSCWEEVYPPKWVGSYPDWLDWWKFRLENQRNLMRWRIETLRSVDQNHPLSSHGIAYTLHGMPTHLTNDFDIAAEVDQWGLSAFPIAGLGRPNACDYFRLLDLVRSASVTHGKKFWQSELQGGQVCGGLFRGAIPESDDTAFWNWGAFMCGAKGLMYWQWRPELLGPESPGFGLCHLDGSPSERTETAGWFAKFMNEHSELAEAEPVKGDVAIVVIPESQLFAYVSGGSTDPYAQSVFGVYQALWNVNVQVDFCTLDDLDDLDEYPLVYLPFPLMLEQCQAGKLREYVANGGVLISDPAPGHFTDHGYCCTKVPGMGLDGLFGAIQDEMESVADGDTSQVISWGDEKIPCSFYVERLIPQGGMPVANYLDGSVAVVDNTFGKGKTRLIGTCLGKSCLSGEGSTAQLLIRDALEYAGVEPMIRVSDDVVKARAQTGPAGTFLWLCNTAHEVVPFEVILSSDLGDCASAVNLVDDATLGVADGTIQLELGPLAGAVLALK